MVFAARDHFEAGRPPPSTTTPPAEGPMFDYLVDRLFDSFGLPLGPVRYLELMNPALPDGETLLSVLRLVPHGRAWRMVNQEWPKVRSEIDDGHPSPLGLVRVKSANPFDLKKNHQVLAYGYELTGNRLVVHLYDPNWPDRNDVRMSLDLAGSSRATKVSYAPPSLPVYGFFRVEYRPSSVP
jgi:hypothetical protein